MYKFRTMKKDSHKLRNTLTKMNKSDGPLFKIEHDPRILKGLHFVRKFSLKIFVFYRIILALFLLSIVYL